jgi:hypothetical protein
VSSGRDLPSPDDYAALSLCYPQSAQGNNPSGVQSGVSNWDGFATYGAQASASGLGSPAGGMRAMHTGAGFSSYPQTANVGATPSGKTKKIRFCLSPMAAASASPAAMFGQSDPVRPKRLHDAMAAASPLSSPIRKVCARQSAPP